MSAYTKGIRPGIPVHPTKPGMRAQKKTKSSREPASPSSPQETETLKGWQRIAEFLGQPVSVAQRWAKDGMPVARAGRSVTATREQLTTWLGKEAGGEPVRVPSAESDLAAELKRGLAFVRKEKRR